MAFKTKLSSDEWEGPLEMIKLYERTVPQLLIRQRNITLENQEVTLPHLPRIGADRHSYWVRLNFQRGWADQGRLLVVFTIEGGCMASCRPSQTPLRTFPVAQLHVILMDQKHKTGNDLKLRCQMLRDLDR